MPHPPSSYAGIGSRQTPLAILRLMEIIAFRLAEGGHTLRSGGAPGADLAFESGCDAAMGKKEIFIPWNGFQNRSAHLENGVISGYCHRALKLASEIHPNWAACSPSARMLHARNCYQILGKSLNHPVSDVVCWTPGGSGAGGTGQAIRLARKYGIPVWDLGDEKTLETFGKNYV
jgi:hypothetical protein